MQPEIRFQPFARNALQHIVGTPAAPARGYRNAVHADDEVRSERLRRDVAHGGGALTRARERLGPTVWSLLDCLVAHVDELLRSEAAECGIHFHAAQLAEMIEQGQLVGEFADPEPQRLAVGIALTVADAQGQGVELRGSVAVGPPQTRIAHAQLRKLRRIQFHFGTPRRHRQRPRDAHALEARFNGGCCGFRV